MNEVAEKMGKLSKFRAYLQGIETVFGS